MSQCPFPLRFASRTSRAFFFSQRVTVLTFGSLARQQVAMPLSPPLRVEDFAGIFLFSTGKNGMSEPDDKRAKVAMPLSPPLRVEDFAGIFLFSTLCATHWRFKMAKKVAMPPKSPERSEGARAFFFSQQPDGVRGVWFCQGRNAPSGIFLFSTGNRRRVVAHCDYRRNAPSGIFLFSTTARSRTMPPVGAGVAMPLRAFFFSQHNCTGGAQ